MQNKIRELHKEHQSVFVLLEKSFPQIEKILEILYLTIKKNNKIMFCGNGGSAADSQHLAAEFIGRFEKERRSLPAVSLTTDTSILTSVGNDYSFNEIFSRQVEGLGNSGDALVCISTSGNSQNLEKVINTANEMNISTIGLLGKGGGVVKDKLDYSIVIDSNSTARIQEAHIFIGHVFCSLLDELIISENHTI